MKLSDKVAIVVGGASGMGRDTSFELATEGAKVVVCDKNIEGAQETASRIKEQGQQAFALQVDQTKIEDIEKLVRMTLDEFKEINILVVTAGTGKFTPFLEISKEEWLKIMEINLNGVFYVCQAVAKVMVDQKKGGKVVIVSSTGAEMPTNQLSHYCVSKAGLKMLTQCMASELGNYRINVNCILPGLIETAMTGPMLERKKWQHMAKVTTPLGRWGQAWEVAKLISFLVSDDASFINGQAISICGGYSLVLKFNWFPIDYSESFNLDWKKPQGLFPFI